MVAFVATAKLFFALAAKQAPSHAGQAFQASSPKLSKGQRKLAFFLFSTIAAYDPRIDNRMSSSIPRPVTHWLALTLKYLNYVHASHHLRKSEQRTPDYLAINPQGMEPGLVVGDEVLTQSLAICEYLDEFYQNQRCFLVNLWPVARVRAAGQVIACDIHPIQNLEILDRLRANGFGADAVNQWARDVIEEGLAAFEALLPKAGTPFCFGETPRLADTVLVPQLVNARRFGAKLESSRILQIEANCRAVDAFQQARPEVQPDAE